MPVGAISSYSGVLVHAARRTWNEFTDRTTGEVRPAGVALEGTLSQAFSTAPLRFRFDLQQPGSDEMFEQLHSAGYMARVTLVGEMRGNGRTQQLLVHSVHVEDTAPVASVA